MGRTAAEHRNAERLRRSMLYGVAMSESRKMKRHIKKPGPNLGSVAARTLRAELSETAVREEREPVHWYGPFYSGKCIETQAAWANMRMQEAERHGPPASPTRQQAEALMPASDEFVPQLFARAPQSFASLATNMSPRCWPEESTFVSGFKGKESTDSAWFRKQTTIAPPLSATTRGRPMTADAGGAPTGRFLRRQQSAEGSISLAAMARAECLMRQTRDYQDDRPTGGAALAAQRRPGSARPASPNFKAPAVSDPSMLPPPTPIQAGARSERERPRTAPGGAGRPRPTTSPARIGGGGGGGGGAANRQGIHGRELFKNRPSTSGGGLGARARARAKVSATALSRPGTAHNATTRPRADRHGDGRRPKYWGGSTTAFVSQTFTGTEIAKREKERGERHQRRWETTAAFMNAYAGRINRLADTNGDLSELAGQFLSVTSTMVAEDEDGYDDSAAEGGHEEEAPAAPAAVRGKHKKTRKHRGHATRSTCVINSVVFNAALEPLFRDHILKQDDTIVRRLFAAWDMKNCDRVSWMELLASCRLLARTQRAESPLDKLVAVFRLYDTYADFDLTVATAQRLFVAAAASDTERHQMITLYRQSAAIHIRRTVLDKRERAKIKEAGRGEQPLARALESVKLSLQDVLDAFHNSPALVREWDRQVDATVALRETRKAARRVSTLGGEVVMTRDLLVLHDDQGVPRPAWGHLCS